MPPPRIEPISRECGIWRLTDGEVNAYAIVSERRALLIDPILPWSGTALKKITADACEEILLTRPSNDRFLHCPLVPIHLPGPAAPLLASRPRSFALRRPINPFYDAPKRRPRGLIPDLAEGRNFLWRGRSFAFLPTPGHTDAAFSILLQSGGELFCFCGDAVCANGKYWRPHHLEWDHWTSLGARAALRGIDRLCNLPLTRLLPARGNPVFRSPRKSLQKTRQNLENWARTKEAFVPGVEVEAWPSMPAGPGVKELLPRLYQLEASGYFLSGNTGKGTLIDALPVHEAAVRRLVRKHRIKELIATSTHYHCDHTDGLEHWRSKYGAQVILCSNVAPIVRHPQKWAHLPYLGEPLRRAPDLIAKFGKPLPLGGDTFTWLDFPGQTRYHSAISVHLDGVRVIFTGDNFFHPLRYNGTGGCAVANESSPEGYATSARLVLSLSPDLIAAGHQAAFRFSPAYFRAVLRWAGTYRRALERMHHPGDGDGYFSTGHDSRP